MAPRLANCARRVWEDGGAVWKLVEAILGQRQQRRKTRGSVPRTVSFLIKPAGLSETMAPARYRVRAVVESCRKHIKHSRLWCGLDRLTRNLLPCCCVASPRQSPCKQRGCPSLAAHLRPCSHAAASRLYKSPTITPLSLENSGSDQGTGCPSGCGSSPSANTAEESMTPPVRASSHKSTDSWQKKAA